MVILDWEMPTIDGMHFVRLVRSPGAFQSGCPDHRNEGTLTTGAWLGRPGSVFTSTCLPVSTRGCTTDRGGARQSRPMIKVEGQYVPGPRGSGGAAPAAKPDASDGKPRTTEHRDVILVN